MWCVRRSCNITRKYLKLNPNTRLFYGNFEHRQELVLLTVSAKCGQLLCEVSPNTSLRKKDRPINSWTDRISARHRESIRAKRVDIFDRISRNLVILELTSNFFSKDWKYQFPQRIFGDQELPDKLFGWRVAVRRFLRKPRVRKGLNKYWIIWDILIGSVLPI